MASLSIIPSNSNSNSYDIAKSLIIAVAKAKLFLKLQLQSKLKTNLYLKTGLDKQLQIGGWEGHLNFFIRSKVIAILVNGGI